MNDGVVLDASALLALMHAEPGDAIVAATLPGALISAVNLAEVTTKLVERGMPVGEAHSDALALGVRVVPFDAEQARMAAELRPLTRAAGLSLGDRCCLALARRERALALTAEHEWLRIAEATGVAIRNIRPAT